MPIDFPNSPSNGATYTVGTKTWQFDGTTWNLLQGTAGIATGAVTEEKIAASAVTESKIHTSAITHSKINDGAVTAGKIASNAVTEAKINDGAVTQNKLASGLSGITVTTTALRSSVVPSPFTGQFVFLTDTSALQRWDGSSWVTAITTVPTGAPTGLALVSATTTTATISFSAGPDGGSTITNYQYALSTNGGTTFGSYTALSPADGSSPITITGLSIGTSYQVKLKAVNALGTGSSESNALSFATTNFSVEYLVVAGGGGGGPGYQAGGGGAGGYRTNVVGATSGRNSSAESSMAISLGTYTVTVGGGGAGGLAMTGTGSNKGTNGQNSVFSTITSLGGGGGASYWNGSGNGAGLSGGSGGGGAATSGNESGGAGTAGQGYDGGATTGYANPYCGGGGGGAGSAGATGGGAGLYGNGGNGLSSSITGSSTARAGGGGGGTYDGANLATATAGGGGGGRFAGGGNVLPTAGTSNTGGGGGGAAGTGETGANGGSGIVVVRYLTADASGLTITGGTKVVGPTGATTYTVHTFTSSGSLVVA